MANITQHKKFVLVEFENGNHNKVWNITEYDNGEILVEWGRVGQGQQSKLHPPHAKRFDTLVNSKLRKGYTENKVVSSVSGGVVSKNVFAKSQLKDIAVKQIKYKSEIVRKLIEEFSALNVHNIFSASSGSITFDTTTAQFKTPQGIIAPDQVIEAREVLNDLADLVAKQSWNDRTFSSQLNRYLRLIPHSLGMRRIEPRSVLPDLTAVQRENDLLDGLDTSFIDIKKTAKSTKKKGKKDDAEEEIFDVELLLVKDYKTIKRIKGLYHDTKKTHHHRNTAGLDVKNVYKVVITKMTNAFDKYGKNLKNRMELWHGTKMSNLLSILKQGLIIPPSSSSHCTGRMYGNGLYFSSISTKALNYATGYWGHGGSTSRYFMFLADVAMGKYHIASGGWGSYNRKGYDSVWAKGGQSGVVNDEMIVYRLDQANLLYLVEFS